MAPIYCSHCLEEGHMKPKYPYLRNRQQANPANGAPTGQASNQIRTASGQTQKTTTMASLAVQGEANELEKRFKKQMESMERRKMDAMRKMLTPTNNVQGSNRNNQAKAVRTRDEMQEAEGAQSGPDGSAPEIGFQVLGSNAGSWPEYGRLDHLKILKLADKKQLSLLECGGNQITKELECESNHSVVHVGKYAEYLRIKGHDVDQRVLAKTLKGKRSVIVYLKDKERRAFGPVQIGLKIDFIEIMTTTWVVLDEELIEQIFVGRNELSLRAVGPPTGIRSALIAENATMTVQIEDKQGQSVELHGMLDIGAGVSVISAEAWQKLGAVPLKPWVVPIRMANDQPIRVLSVTDELQMNPNGPQLPVSFIVVEHLGEDDFLLGRTFIRDFDVLNDLRQNSTLVRDPSRTRRLQRKEVIGSYSERMKLIVEAGTIVRPKEVTLCRLKLPSAAGKLRNDRQVCVLPIEDIRHEANCASAGRTLTLTKDGRVAVPFLNRTDREFSIRQGQKVAYALPAFTELMQKLSDCLRDDCKACKTEYKCNLCNVKSFRSSAVTPAGPFQSGRSNFPAKDQLDKVELLPNLEELRDRITTAQLERLHAVLEANAAVFAKNKADVGRSRLMENRLDLEPDAVPHSEGARRMAPWKGEKANEEVRHLLIFDLIEPCYSP